MATRGETEGVGPGGPPEPAVRAGRILLLVAPLLLASAFWSVVGTADLLDFAIEDPTAMTLSPGHTQVYIASIVCALLFVPVAWRLRCEQLWGLAAARSKWLVPAIAAVAAFASFLFCALVLEHAWMTDDEQIYLLQVAGLKAGTVWMPAPDWPLTPRLLVLLGEEDGVSRWAGPYMPGQPLLLLLGELLHLPRITQYVGVWLIVYHAARAAGALGGERAAVATALLVGSSPMLIGIGGTMHTSLPATVMAVLAIRALLEAARRKSVGPAALLGLFAASAVCFRPIEGALVTGFGCAALAGIAVSQRDARLFGRFVVGAAAGAVLPTLFLLWTNYKVSGSPLVIPYQLLSESSGRFYGLGDSEWAAATHGVASAMTNAMTTASHLSLWLFASPLPLLALAVTPRAPGHARFWLAAFASVAALFVAYAIAPFHSVADFGSYYHLPVLPVLAIYAGCALTAPSPTSESTGPVGAIGSGVAAAALLRAEPCLQRRASRVVIAGIALGWLTFVPLQLARLSGVAASIWEPIRFVEQAVETPALITYSGPAQRAREGGLRSAVVLAPLPHSADDPILWVQVGSRAHIGDLIGSHPTRHAYHMTLPESGLELTEIYRPGRRGPGPTDPDSTSGPDSISGPAPDPARGAVVD